MGLKVVDASRRFNCGSYNHSLKECPKPRDNVAVNNARKQHKSRCNKNAGSCNPTRYYQNSAGGKYDGLRPGVLDAETRKLLGLGELDPPPWLNRMRQMGYPPGYLVTVNGVTYDEPGMIKQAVESHFKFLFTEDWKNRPKLSGFFDSISSVDSSEVLEAEFLEDEIWEALKDCEGNKAPGPDGFNLKCIQKCWAIMKENPVGLGDFRPISLITSVYKIIAKVLSRRLRKVLPKIISEVQTAFLSGRHIIDGVLIANEVVDWWKRSKKKGLILKLDFEKAYDSVNWEFLYSMMKNFGFGEKWVGWMKTCISTARISVLVNGSPTSEFSPMKGLRQGDPLSPLLFNIVAEGLNILLERAKEVGLIRGVSVGSSELIITHLQFADDTIIFCEAEWEEVVAVKRILRCFELMSGLKINFHKSKVCGVGVQEDIVQVFANKLNCLSQKLPMSYLGLPLGANPRRKASWKPVLDKFKRKLAAWKRRYLSFAGRVTLIKSVLSSLPVYFLSIFKLPVGIAKALHRIQANFLWGGSEIRKKVHLINWKEVCLSKIKGGLGVRNLSQLDPEVEEQEQRSGITIFTDEGNKEEKEDDGEIGKILEKVYPDRPRKMNAEFPGINAPIPENADERRWTTAGPSSSDLAKNQSHCRSNFSLESISRGMYHRQRWSRDIRNEGPPGIDPGFSPTLSGYTSQTAQVNISVPISPSFGESRSPP
ncbi:unnamed protein product [Camellia sinensis]